MQAGNHQVHQIVIDKQRTETQQGDRRCPAAFPTRCGPRVQVRGVNHPGDERPGLLRIPAPVAAPGGLRPDRPGNDRERPDREGKPDHPVGDAVQSHGRGQAHHDPAALAHRGGRVSPTGGDSGEPVLPAVLQQIQDGRDRRDHEHAAGDDRRNHMNLEPVGVERRDKRSHGDVEHRGGETQIENHRNHHENAQPTHPRPGPRQHGQVR